MGWHHLTDYMCSKCHDPVDDEECDTCGCNLCKSCTYVTNDFPHRRLTALLKRGFMDYGPAYEYIYGKSKSQEDDESKDVVEESFNVCKDCYEVLENICDSCENSSLDDLQKCNNCSGYVCEGCGGKLYCWKCVREEESFNEFLLSTLRVDALSEFVRAYEIEYKKAI